MKKNRLIIYLGILAFLCFLHIATSQAVSCLSGQQGGTGICNTSSTNISKALIVSSTDANGYVTWTLGVAGGGGGSGSLNGTGTVTYFPTWLSTTTLSSTSSLLQDATGTIWLNNVSTSQPYFVIGTTTASTSCLFCVATGTKIFTINSDGSIVLHKIVANSFLATDGNSNITATSTPVTTITGTANQITASGASGAVTLSIPTTLNVTAINASGALGVSSSITQTGGSNSFAGNVAIGTTTPVAQLQLDYDATSSNSTKLTLQLGDTALVSPNANGTYLGVNVPTGFTGNVFDVQKNGASILNLNTNGAGIGNLTAASNMQANTAVITPIVKGFGNGVVNWQTGTGSNNTAGTSAITITENYTTAFGPLSGNNNMILFNGSPFNPSTGTGTLASFDFQPSINQGISASGITRGIYISSTLPAAYDFRPLEIATANVRLSTSTLANGYWARIQAPTLGASTTASTSVTNYSTLDITGAPISTVGSSSITTSRGIYVESNNVTASTTNAYGLEVDSPTGATNNLGILVAGTSSTIRLGVAGTGSVGCIELYDAANSSTLNYLYSSSTALIVTATKPSFCQ